MKPCGSALSTNNLFKYRITFTVDALAAGLLITRRTADHSPLQFASGITGVERGFQVVYTRRIGYDLNT
jgi:hypothetical protein